MSIHRFLKQWVLPPMIYRTLGQAHFEMMDNTTRVIRENIRFKYTYAGRRCFVIGTGSSLYSTPLNRIPTDDISIVVNRFYLSEYADKFRPTLCCMADRANDADKDLFQEIVRNTNPTDGFFLHESLEPIVGDLGKDIHYFRASSAMDTLVDVRPDWDFHSRIPGCSSAGLIALTLAMYLGCNPIYLLGTDCDWLTHRGANNHCYAADEHEPVLSDVPYSHTMKQGLRQFRSYEVLKRYADMRSIRIYNASPGSFLDVFPDIDYKLLFDEDQRGVIS